MDQGVEMIPATAGQETANEPGPFLCKICSKAFTKSKIQLLIPHVRFS